MRHSTSATHLTSSNHSFGGRSKIELNIIDVAIAQTEQFLEWNGEDMWYDEAVEVVVENISKRGVQISKEELCEYLLYRNKTPREQFWMDAIQSYHKLVMDILDSLEDERRRCTAAAKVVQSSDLDSETCMMLKSRLYECCKIQDDIMNICRSKLEDKK